MQRDHEIGRASCLETHFICIFRGSALVLILLDIFISDPGTKRQEIDLLVWQQVRK